MAFIGMIAEALRRTIWSIIRVENEHLNIKASETKGINLYRKKSMRLTDMDL
jgi:hypothetical protein